MRFSIAFDYLMSLKQGGKKGEKVNLIFAQGVSFSWILRAQGQENGEKDKG